jgi:hypothetical protein
VRPSLSAPADLLTDKHTDRLRALFADDAHVEVEATWGIYQRMIATYRHPDRRRGRELMVNVIESVSVGVPKALVEINKLGRTLTKRAEDVLAYFDRPGTSNGPPRQSTGGSSTCAAPRSGFRNSPTTSPDRCSRQAVSGRNYTLDREEPVCPGHRRISRSLRSPGARTPFVWTKTADQILKNANRPTTSYPRH